MSSRAMEIVSSARSWWGRSRKNGACASASIPDGGEATDSGVRGTNDNAQPSPAAPESKPLRAGTEAARAVGREVRDAWDAVTELATAWRNDLAPEPAATRRPARARVARRRVPAPSVRVPAPRAASAPPRPVSSPAPSRSVASARPPTEQSAPEKNAFDASAALSALSAELEAAKERVAELEFELSAETERVHGIVRASNQERERLEQEIARAVEERDRRVREISEQMQALQVRLAQAEQRAERCHLLERQFGWEILEESSEARMADAHAPQSEPDEQ